MYENQLILSGVSKALLEVLYWSKSTSKTRWPRFCPERKQKGIHAQSELNYGCNI